VTRTLSLKTLGLGFVAGALAVLVFHQGMILLLHLAGQIPNFPWSMRPVPPLGVPALVNSMFWGGVWGLLFALVVNALPVTSIWLKGIIFGILGPWLLGNGVLVPLIKGGPLLFGFSIQRMMVGAMIGAAFGLGLGLIFDVLRRRI
jgi:uncharacterized membrane protein YagU involved in acid resistance